MRNIFKRRRPEPAPAPTPISHSDLNVAHAHGLTLERWDALPAMVKADLRERVVYADSFGVAK